MAPPDERLFDGRPVSDSARERDVLVEDLLFEERMEPDEQVSEDVLLHRAKDGSGSAFAELCARHETALRARIRRFLSAPVRRKLSVLDVLQETYIAAHRGLPAFENRGEGAFGAWVGRIAELKTRDAVRRFVGTEKRDLGREVTRGHRPDTAHVPGRVATPSEMAMADEKNDEVLAAMDDLPESHRRILRLVQVEHVSFDVAASLMGRSRQAVRKLYGRALARLADRLEADRER